MRSKNKIMTNLLAIVVTLLSPAYLYSCSASREIADEKDIKAQNDSVDRFIPPHPPIVVPHSWREGENH